MAPTESTMILLADRVATETEMGTIGPAERGTLLSGLRQLCLTLREVPVLAQPATAENDGAKSAADETAIQFGIVSARIGLNAESVFRIFRRLRELISESTAELTAPTDQEQLGRILEALLERAVIAYINEKTHTLTDNARRDPLTRLLNRSAFDSSLRDEVERARRYSRDLSLVLLDVDRFKSVNDLLGHPAGDEVLLAVAETLRSSLRHSDLAFRYGGDEFAAICPETAGNVIHGLLERLESNLRQKFAEANLHQDVGISWGVSSLAVDAVDVAGMIQIADQRLYACKQTHHRQHA